MQPVLATFIIGLLNLVVGFAFGTRAVWGNLRGIDRWQSLFALRSSTRQRQLESLEMLENQQAAATESNEPLVEELIQSLKTTATRLRELLQSVADSEATETEAIDARRIELGEICIGLLSSLKEAAQELGAGHDLEATLQGPIAQIEGTATRVEEMEYPSDAADAIRRLAADAKALQGTAMGLLTNLEARQFATKMTALV